MYTNTVPTFPYKQQRSMAVCKFTGRINRYTNSPVANYKGEMYNMPLT